MWRRCLPRRRYVFSQVEIFRSRTVATADAAVSSEGRKYGKHGKRSAKAGNVAGADAAAHPHHEAWRDDT